MSRAPMFNQEQVERGIALLDRRHPGWQWEVDTDILDMDDVFRCIMGQLYGYFYTGLKRLGIQYPERYGFDTDEDNQYNRLTESWLRYLDQYREEHPREGAKG